MKCTRSSKRATKQGCILQNEPEPKIVWLVFDEKCKNSFKHVFSINVLNKLKVRFFSHHDLHQLRAALLINKINAKNSRGILTQMHI